jgi:hypothetical protein
MGGTIMGLTLNSNTTGSYIQTENGKIVPSGRRNYLINSNFDRWQYATSQTSAGYGSDDRWQNANSGSTKTHSQVACTDTERALFNATYFSRTVVTSVSGAGNFVSKGQSIENVTLLAGKTVTLSFWAKADSNKNIGMHCIQSFGTGGTQSSSVYGIGKQLITLTTTWQKKTITVTFPSIVGKTLGTDGVHTTSSGIYFGFDIGSNHSVDYNGMIQQSGTFDIAQVKIEDGSVATDGWHPYDGEFGGEVQACQRYYEVVSVNMYMYYPAARGIYVERCYFRTSKRATPTTTRADGYLFNVWTLIMDGQTLDGVRIIAYSDTASPSEANLIIYASAEL